MQNVTKLIIYHSLANKRITRPADFHHLNQRPMRTIASELDSKPILPL